jgi:GNAT superfamily N-acetyltransferase
LTHSARIRVAKHSDALAITALINAAFRVAEGFFIVADRIDLASVLGYLDSGVFRLAERDGVLLGCVYVEMQTGDSLVSSDPRAYLGLLSVDPDHQHAGSGSVLMDAAEAYAAGRGAVAMDIKVVSLREELFAYYQRRGYVENGVSDFPAEIETRMPCHFVEMSKALNEDQE